MVTGMDIEDLKTFLCIAETKNFSRAGSQLFISQSAVTARIKALEKELHRQLFIRNNTSVELTMYGKTFLRYAKNACDLVEEGRRALNLSEDYSASLCIGAPDSVWRYSLFPLVPQLKSTNPDIALHMLCEHSATLTEGILDALVDMAVVVAEPNQRLIHCEPLWASDFALVSSPALALPEVPFTPQTIRRFPFIQMYWGQAFLHWFEDNYDPNIFPYKIDRVFLYMDLLLHGIGIGFLPRRIAAVYLEAGTLVEIPYQSADTAPKENGYLICLEKRRQDLEPFAQKIRDLIQERPCI